MERHLSFLTISEAGKEQGTINKLDNLMKFLQIEVEIEQRSNWLKVGFL